jgi:hypothetical protein
MPDTVPGCALQNFTPNATAPVPAAAGLVGTALPKIVIGDYASAVLGTEHPMTRTQENEPDMPEHFPQRRSREKPDSGTEVKFRQPCSHSHRLNLCRFSQDQSKWTKSGSTNYQHGRRKKSDIPGFDSNIDLSRGKEVM